MLHGLVDRLRRYGIPVAVGEYLDLLAALDRRVVTADFEEFHLLARTLLVKDETRFDRFDRAFDDWYRSALTSPPSGGPIPEEWLRARFEKRLTKEELDAIERVGGLSELLKRLEERLREQRERHEGGNRFVGTGGTSPFGAFGGHPEGVRMGGSSRMRAAAKVWERRDYQSLDDRLQLGTRNFQLALRRLRRFAREGAAEEFDLPETIRHTAASAGLLDVRFRPERRNVVRVILLFDVGGSMNEHVHTCERLFSAARYEFKRSRTYYFHNCVYESVWPDAGRRFEQRVGTEELLRTTSPFERLLIVGDASMHPFELIETGGAIEHWNEVPGLMWIARLFSHFRRAVWLNPVEPEAWREVPSIGMLQRATGAKMFPLTLSGLGSALDALR